MSNALEKHDGKVSIGGRNITNLRFADGIDALAEKERKLEGIAEVFTKRQKVKDRDQAEKTKLITNSIRREIKVNRQKLGTVTRFKYLGENVSNDG